MSGGAGRESDPRQWWRALGEAVGRTGWADRAAAVSVGGQQHGLVTLDAAGEPVRPALLWNDVRSAPQAAALVAEYGPKVWAERAGSVPGRPSPPPSGSGCASGNPRPWPAPPPCGCRTTT